MHNNWQIREALLVLLNLMDNIKNFNLLNDNIVSLCIIRTSSFDRILLSLILNIQATQITNYPYIESLLDNIPGNWNFCFLQTHRHIADFVL